MRKIKLISSFVLILMMLCTNILPQGMATGEQITVSSVVAAEDTWPVAEAGGRQEITIHNPSGTILENIPVLVRLNSSNIPNKDGVSFYTGKTRLPSELASWNATGMSTYWVKVPALAAEGDTVITAYYCGSNAAVTNSAADVWSDGYELVQHFSESAVGAGKDSTGNGVSKKTGTLTYQQDDLGGAALFTGTQKISYNNKAIGANASVFSASAVVKFTALAGDKGYYGIVCRDRNGAQEGDTFMLTLSNNNVNASVYPDGKVSSRVNAQKAVEAGIPYLLTMTYDGTDLKLYINGALVKTVPAANAALLNSTLSPFTIGAYSDTDVKSGLNGELYDVFFKTSVISEDEETFRHENYLGSAVSVGALETREVADSPLSPGIHYLYDAITADTYCFSNGEDGKKTNFGDANTVMQKRTKISDAPDFLSSANRRAFIKLDLSAIAKLDLDRIESVSFDFYQNGDGGATNKIDARIVDVDPSSWDERTVTWANMPPTYGLPAVAEQSLTKKKNEYQSFEMTNYIKNKLAEGKTEISFSIDNNPSNEWGLIWYSRESANNKPRITVQIKTPAAPELSTEINGNAAVLSAQIPKESEDAAEVKFYQTKNIPLNSENTAVYSGETAEELPDTLTTAMAGQSEPFSGSNTTAANGKTPYQIYEITLSEQEKTQATVEVDWTGNTAGDQRDVTAYYYNQASNRWVQTGSTNGMGEISITSTIPVSEALDQNGKIQILIWRGMNQAIDGRASYAPSVGEYDFNIMWVTDTQKYFAPSSNLPHVKKQFNWIADHYDEMKSKLLIHTGDMVENYDNPEQWQTMRDLYDSTIEAKKIPHAFTVGNHDVNRTDSSKNIFQDYFSVEYLKKNNPYFGDTFGDDMTYYYLMEEAGAKLMFVGLGMPITQDAAEWVNSALERHPDYTAVLMPHIYLLPDGSVDNTERYGSEVTIKKLRTIIEQNSNVRLVLCGHHTGASANLEYFDSGKRPVWSMMYDYQDLEEGGKGYFRFLKFDIENNLIYTHTYSASDNGTAMFTDKQTAITGMYQKHRDEYAVRFDFGASKEKTLSTESLVLKVPGDQIGDTQTISGGGLVSVVWDGLEVGSTYSWFAGIKDGAGHETITDIQEFTVPELIIDDISYTNETVTVKYTATGLKDGTPVGILAFAAQENDTPDIDWNGQNVAYQDIFAHNKTSSIAFQMPSVTENGIAGLDTTKKLIIKMGVEASYTTAKLFTIPEKPEIMSAKINGNNSVTVQLSRPIQGEEVLIVASYNAEGVLLEMKQETMETIIAQGENEYVMSIVNSDDVRTVKAMWWNDLNSMQPLCEMKPVEVTNN